MNIASLVLTTLILMKIRTLLAQWTRQSKGYSAIHLCLAEGTGLPFYTRGRCQTCT